MLAFLCQRDTTVVVWPQLVSPLLVSQSLPSIWIREKIRRAKKLKKLMGQEKYSSASGGKKKTNPNKQERKSEGEVKQKESLHTK